MPAHHHRTVDRLVAILEYIARSGERPVGLGALAQHLQAPKSSVQALVDGLIAAGYLVEHDHQISLGAGPFVLTLLGNRAASVGFTHHMLEHLHREIGHSIPAGRRSLYATASGKIILGELSQREMDAFLLAAPPDEQDDVNTFLRELPGIRATRLAYNLGATVPQAIAVATDDKR
jgi:DNA-binding IclR family transcriptional regulator